MSIEKALSRYVAIPRIIIYRYRMNLRAPLAQAEIVLCVIIAARQIMWVYSCSALRGYPLEPAKLLLSSPDNVT